MGTQQADRGGEDDDLTFTEEDLGPDIRSISIGAVQTGVRGTGIDLTGNRQIHPVASMSATNR